MFQKHLKNFVPVKLPVGIILRMVKVVAPSILNSAIDDLINIHEHIDDERRNWLEKIRTISEQAKEKQVLYLFILST